MFLTRTQMRKMSQACRRQKDCPGCPWISKCVRREKLYGKREPASWSKSFCNHRGLPDSCTEKGGQA